MGVMDVSEAKKCWRISVSSGRSLGPETGYVSSRYFAMQNESATAILVAESNMKGSVYWGVPSGRVLVGGAPISSAFAWISPTWISKKISTRKRLLHSPQLTHCVIKGIPLCCKANLEHNECQKEQTWEFPAEILPDSGYEGGIRRIRTFE